MIAALLMLIPIAPVPPEPKPVPTTIAAIHASPKKFDGQLVRLHGYVNGACAPSSCAIDERASKDPRGAGERLSAAGDAKFYDTLRLLIPTYVEVDARVNAACVAAACTGGAPALAVVTLRGVVSPEPPPFEN
jgi:hypothetical protein